ncbi:hypothetical protein AMS69_10135 [Haloarcula rubripromontorii]|uniref:Restriction endonuclease n=1 Tax=Haloarcula rubripromontorii TaxID=1705562 RepID=A0A0M9AL16_9EURY|nr:hypothetical protein [Haloarcula rubripromontorii]KOX92811.1 hypothetical protein AMS69_10135 [Haloarcula rubripromontorii]
MSNFDFQEDVEELIYEHFRSEYDHDTSAIPNEEKEEIEYIVNTVGDDLLSNVGELGVALDFILVAEDLSQVDSWVSGFDPDLTRDEILDHYQTKDTNTLTIRFDDDWYSIRSIQNDLRDLFRYELRRTNFPSSPGHHTGNWDDYDDLLERAFRLSRPGRFEAVGQLFELGLERLNEKRMEARDPPFPRPFSEIVENYQRSYENENGGLAFQAMIYGYMKAEYGHLSFRASKVRTGSSRQNRYGDIDGFLGPDLMVSAEVKDLYIDEQNVRSELGTTIQLSNDSTAIPLAVCKSVSENAREILKSEGVEVLTNQNLLDELRQWDYHKQDRAVQGALHYLANIEEDPSAVERLLQFLDDVDSNNIALDHLIED